ncbi:MAG: transketolase [Candidatus Melainabacteria bacterium RIFOXYA12_FULL_32_12]|nr:MAG: transketolase [Candidatus Melainabacteria bacterium GWF2_32_7]OGI19220.1 MAG: transketolase [Candidatus Melainabacteria bacterium RIFOXYA2_FULL_32_9]OGI26606.1 MAG: transketolase [Candidatus Melainabacteria bacterium RIFOXYA12_FULL_32_12]
MTRLSGLSEKEIAELSKISRKIREYVVSMIHAAKSGHTGGSLSAVDLLVVLYFKHLKHYKDWDKDPNWLERDRFVLSKGHASPTLYSVLAESGYLNVEELKTFRALYSRLQGHPTYGRLPGIEVSTGSLGQGLSLANGIALGLKLDNRSSRVYCLLGDGEIQEGQVWEAAMSAAHYKLNNITAIVDRNCLQIDGNTECVMSLEPVEEKWKGFGWQVIKINGHDHQEIYEALQQSISLSQEKNSPVMIIADTVKGKGVSFMENNPSWHGKAPNDEELKKALEEIRGL